MRLSEWRATAPAKDAVSPKVSAVVDPVLTALGAAPDPHCWVAWGEEPANRYTLFVPTDPGLLVCFLRVNVPGEGPRATTKLVRWSKVTIGELSVETQAGHRMLSFQIESQVLRGVDAEADRAAAFALRVIAAIDGRPLPPVEEEAGRRRAASESASPGAGSATPNAPANAPATAKTSGAAKGAAPKAAAARSLAGATADR
ncbi:MAG: hypothetical protein ABIZ72_03440 [Candidatus Limnocylindrales bacterium]